jgi:hypothetical protein
MALLGGVAPASAGAAWTSPVTLSASGQNAGSAQVAVDAQGDTVFVWLQFDGVNWRVQTRSRSAAGTLTPIQSLSAPGRNASRPQVAVDADGDAVFSWERYDGTHWLIQARARSRTGVLSPVQTLSAPGQNAYFPQLAVDADGDAVFTWQRSDGARDRIQARARSAGGTLSQVKTLSVAGKNARQPQVGISPDGRAVFAWQRFFPTSQRCCLRIEARARSVNGTFSPAQTLSPTPGPHRNAHDPQVGVAADGKALFSWQFVDSSYQYRDYSQIQLRTRSAGGALSPVTSFHSSEYVGGPYLAVNRAGAAALTWDESTYATLPRVFARTRSAAGTLAPIREITSGAHGDSAGVAVDGSGDAILTWTRWIYYPPDYQEVYKGATARVLSASGTLGPFAALSPTGYEPQVAANHAGAAIVTWRDSDGTNTVIQAAAGP